jgi:hypothetical protein
MIEYTEYEKLALLEEIQRGDKVVIPTSVAHAEFMLMVANAYINEHKKEMWSNLTQ